MTRKELHQITEDRKYWQEFGELFGWQLYGWTFRHGATFTTTSPVEPHYQHLIEIRGYQRDDIMRAYQEQAKIVESIKALDDPGLCRITKGDKAMQIIRATKKKGRAA